MGDAVDLISTATDRAVRYVPLPVVEFVAELVTQGWSSGDAEGFADVLTTLPRGMDDHVSDGVRRALGRPPRDFTEFVRDAARAGSWDG
ncbi:hypothetical protein [Actinoalloteichus caeruleus]|uniref:hypothetical protein n=1 Tax=Actinoalloteichus cyanogriseus TaxID=2893586 RepID=UPI000AA770BA